MSNEPSENTEIIQAEYYKASSPTRNYIIVYANDVRPLAVAVGDLMNQGYACQGGVAVGFSAPDKGWFYQSMIKTGTE